MTEIINNILENSKKAYKKSIMINNEELEELLFSIITDTKKLLDKVSDKKIITNNMSSKNRTEDEEIILKEGLFNANSKFMLSTWLSNKYRTNEYVFSVWSDCFVSTKEHFYHVGGKEANRNAVYEALLSNVKLNDSISNIEMKDRINANESQLTDKSKKYEKPKQLTLVLEETTTTNTGFTLLRVLGLI